MRDPIELGRRFDEELGGELRSADYLYADTRIPAVSLYDHLRLTAGLAVALVRELQRRGASAAEILGIRVGEEWHPNDRELLAVARLAGLLHDLGKAREGQTDYRGHVRRGEEYARAWLERHRVEEPLFSILLGTVVRHHLRDRPRTPLEKIVCIADSYASAGDRPELAQASTPRQLRKAAQEILELETELYGEEKPIRLLLADADHIKGYVYETNALPEIRGGSEFLQEVEEGLREEFAVELAEECLIYCGGGGLLAVVPAGEAAAWKERIEERYVAHTRVATATVAVSPPVGYVDFARGLPPHDAESVAKLRGSGPAEDLLLSHFGEGAIQRESKGNRSLRKNFGELVAELSGQLQRAKRQKTWAPFLEAFPVHRRCESCGKRPATEHDPQREEWLCPVCTGKRGKGREEKRTLREKFAEWGKRRGLGLGAIGPPPKDLDELAGEEGRIALIYADGNNMGDLLQRAPSPATYRHISEALSSATEASLFQALVRTFGPEQLRKTLPFEVIALGGDDVVVLTRAGAGYALALALLEEFERHEKIRRLEEEVAQRFSAFAERLRLTMSAGVVMADVKHPMRFLFDLAEGLLKRAKGLARGCGQSTLCHLGLRAPIIAEEAETLLEALYKRGEGRKMRYLTARPYTLEQARTLLGVAGRLAEVPAHARRSLAEALEKGVYLSLNQALYQAARLRDHKEALVESFQELGRLLSISGSDPGLYFWRQDPERKVWRTPLLDALELVELGTQADLTSREGEG